MKTQGSSRVHGFVSAMIAVAAVGCAAGLEDSYSTAQPELQEEEPNNSASLPPPSQPSTSTNPTEPAPTDEGGSGTPDGGSTPTPDAGPPAGSCAATNACATPTQLANVRADEGADLVTHTGTASQWMKIRATEGDTGGPGGKRMKIKARLTSPPGANFDVYMYLASNGSAVNCLTATSSSIATAGVDEARVEWGETDFFNGDEDDRWIMVEVRHVSGTCSATAPWTLQISRW